VIVLPVIPSLRKTVHAQCPNVLNTLHHFFLEVAYVKNVKLIRDGIYRRVPVVNANTVLEEISFAPAMEHVSMVVSHITTLKTKDAIYIVT
jgi:hypothetical protein